MNSTVTETEIVIPLCSHFAKTLTYVKHMYYKFCWKLMYLKTEKQNRAVPNWKEIRMW